MLFIDVQSKINFIKITKMKTNYKAHQLFQQHYDAEVYPKISALVKFARNLDTYNKRN